jgi:hypothetical protein
VGRIEQGASGGRVQRRDSGGVRPSKRHISVLDRSGELGTVDGAGAVGVDRLKHAQQVRLPHLPAHQHCPSEYSDYPDRSLGPANTARACLFETRRRTPARPSTRESARTLWHWRATGCGVGETSRMDETSAEMAACVSA